MGVARIFTKKIEPATTTAISGLWIVLGAASLFALGNAFSIISGRVLFSDANSDPRLPLERLPQLLQAAPFPGETAFLTDAPLWLRLLCAGGTLVSIGIFILSGVYLRRVIQNLSLGKPFAPAVLHNWKSLSLVLVVGSMLQGLIEVASFGAIMLITSSSAPNDIWGSNVQSLGVALPNWPWWTLLLGIVTQAILVAFKSGAQLEKDVVGLV